MMGEVATAFLSVMVVFGILGMIVINYCSKNCCDEDCRVGEIECWDKKCQQEFEASKGSHPISQLDTKDN